MYGSVLSKHEEAMSMMSGLSRNAPWVSIYFSELFQFTLAVLRSVSPKGFSLCRAGGQIQYFCLLQASALPMNHTPNKIYVYFILIILMF